MNLRIHSLAAALVLAGGLGMAQAADAPQAVSFSRDIAPVLKVRCATCHLTGEEAGGMALHPKAARASLLARVAAGTEFRVVVPGKPEESYLLNKLEGTHRERGGQGERMPFGAAPLDAADIERIRQWIAAGAPAN
jgi:hypothetical protein